MLVQTEQEKFLVYYKVQIGEAVENFFKSTVFTIQNADCS